MMHAGRKCPGLLVVFITLFLFTACNTGPYTIKSDDFRASSACDATSGYVRLSESGSQPRAESVDYQTFMRSSGMPSIWCHEAVHRFDGTVHLNGYTFESNPDDPLEFTVIRDTGYRYSTGSGAVVTPEGERIELP